MTQLLGQPIVTAFGQMKHSKFYFVSLCQKWKFFGSFVLKIFLCILHHFNITYIASVKFKSVFMLLTESSLTRSKQFFFFLPKSNLEQ